MAVFGVLGGDRRQLYLARSLEEDGHTLFLHGLEGLEGAAAFPTLPLEELGRRCRWWCCPCPLSGRVASSTPPLPGRHPAG